VTFIPHPFGLLQPQGGGDFSPALLVDLIARWKMNESGGDRVDIHAGLTLEESSSSIGSATGVVDDCADFSASGKYLKLDATSYPELDFLDEDFTISCWVRRTASQSDEGVYGKGYTEVRYSLTFSGTSTRLKFEVWGTTGTSVEWSSDHEIDTWYHVVCWHDSVNNEIGIVVDDGTPVTAAHSTGIDFDAAWFKVGREQDFSANSMTGYVDELMVWGRVLDASDITELFDFGNPA